MSLVPDLSLGDSSCHKRKVRRWSDPDVQMYSNTVQHHGDIKSNMQTKQSSSTNQEKATPPVEVNDDYSDYSERSSENDSDTGDNLSSDDDITLYKSPTKKLKKSSKEIFAGDETEGDDSENIPDGINKLMESCVDLQQIIGIQAKDQTKKSPNLIVRKNTKQDKSPGAVRFLDSRHIKTSAASNSRQAWTMDDRFKVPAAKKLSLDNLPNDHKMPQNQNATIKDETKFVDSKKMPLSVDQGNPAANKRPAAKKLQLNNPSATKKLLEIEPEKEKATPSREIIKNSDNQQVIKRQSSLGQRFDSNQQIGENKPLGSKKFRISEYAVPSVAIFDGGANSKPDNRQKAFALMADYTRKLWQTRNNEALARSHNLMYRSSHLIKENSRNKTEGVTNIGGALIHMGPNVGTIVNMATPVWAAFNLEPSGAPQACKVLWLNPNSELELTCDGDNHKGPSVENANTSTDKECNANNPDDSAFVDCFETPVKNKGDEKQSNKSSTNDVADNNDSGITDDDNQGVDEHDEVSLKDSHVSDLESLSEDSKDERKDVFDEDNVETDSPAIHNEEAEISESDDDAVVPNLDENASFHQISRMITPELETSPKENRRHPSLQTLSRQNAFHTSFPFSSTLADNFQDFKDFDNDNSHNDTSEGEATSENTDMSDTDTGTLQDLELYLKEDSAETSETESESDNSEGETAEDLLRQLEDNSLSMDPMMFFPMLQGGVDFQEIGADFQDGVTNFQDGELSFQLGGNLVQDGGCIEEFGGNIFQDGGDSVLFRGLDQTDENQQEIGGNQPLNGVSRADLLECLALNLDTNATHDTSTGVINLNLEMLREDDNQDNTNEVNDHTTAMTATVDNNQEDSSQGSDQANENINDFLNLSQGNDTDSIYSLGQDEDIPGSELSTYLYSETTSSELDILTWNREVVYSPRAPNAPEE